MRLFLVTYQIGINIPHDMKPKTVVVTIAKYVFENSNGQIENNWGKFISLLGLCGALAVDSVEAGYCEGVTEVVDTFGLVVEQVMGEWILEEGGGWEGFIRHNQYDPILSPIPRTIVIVSVICLILYSFIRTILYFFEETYTPGGEMVRFFQKFGLHDLKDQCPNFYNCPNPRNPTEYLYSLYYYF